MKKNTLLLFITIFLSSCANFHPTIPEGYTGPVAIITDTAKSIDSGKADLFYLSHIDDKEILDSHAKTFDASYGRGNNLNLVLLSNRIPISEHKYTIVGRTVYAVPFRALTGTVYEVKGDVTFSPQANGEYIIKGVLFEEMSSVWLEDAVTGEVIKKIEVQGPSKLGIFEK